MSSSEKTYNFIYKTTNILNGKYYIGIHSTDNLNDGYLGSGYILRLAIRKYGKENFVRDVIEFLPNRKLLVEREKEVVNLDEIAKMNCMNLMIGGSGGAQVPEKQRKWFIAGTNGFVNRINNDDEFREKIRNHLITQLKKNHKEGVYTYFKSSFTGKNHTEETKKKMSLKAKKRVGEKCSQYGTMWITNGNDNKKIKKDSEIPEGWNKGRKT